MILVLFNSLLPNRVMCFMSDRIKVVDSWLFVASRDLLSARKLAAPPDVDWFNAVYLCQQSAEKATKALLIFHGENPKRIHDIGFLLGDLSKFSSMLDDMQDAAEILTDFAMEYRYPNPNATPLSESTVAEAIANADIFLSRAKAFIDLNYDQFTEASQLPRPKNGGA